ncbi:hypothetical protein D9758_007435 [Tetrapyrgos nigripes]|uniref:Uncharacterized protein n=1 Tax=Tetrapyrgos nigripes TaxID=182062 RepID=A0A8H5G3M7_9AGAR|nr:hypothetical protein D9758_007435 [Tetrapyrgos nigripes]
MQIWPDFVAALQRVRDTEHLEFSDGWEKPLAINTIFTKTPGSSVTLRFNGTAVEMYSALNSTSSKLSTTVTRQLDDEAPECFSLIPSDSSISSYISDQLLFNLSSLSPGEHTLVLINNLAHDASPCSNFFAIDTDESNFITDCKRQDHWWDSWWCGYPWSTSGFGSLLGEEAQNSTADAIPRGNTDTIHGPSLHGQTGHDFDPYAYDIDRDANVSAQKTSPFMPSSRTEELVNTLRLGNLKLQQRLAVLRGLESPQDQAERQGEGPSARRVHTDSG